MVLWVSTLECSSLFSNKSGILQVIFRFSCQLRVEPQRAAHEESQMLFWPIAVVSGTTVLQTQLAPFRGQRAWPRSPACSVRSVIRYNRVINTRERTPLAPWQPRTSTPPSLGPPLSQPFSVGGTKPRTKPLVWNPAHLPSNPPFPPRIKQRHTPSGIATRAPRARTRPDFSDQRLELQMVPTWLRPKR